MTSGDTQTNLQVELVAIAARVRTLVARHEGQPCELLEILRFLEALHQEIREGGFQSALPTDRKGLYTLLRNIETHGGWPYISRMKLQDLLGYITPQPQEEEPDQRSTSR